MQIIRTTSKNPDFISLVAELDEYLSGINGDNDDFFRQFNKVDSLNHVVLMYNNAEIVGCGAIKRFDNSSVEVKRMYVKPAYRRKGVAKIILTELENWARELKFSFCVLETSKDMIDAVSFYRKQNYNVTPNYGQYTAVETSICFKKSLM